MRMPGRRENSGSGRRQKFRKFLWTKLVKANIMANRLEIANLRKRNTMRELRENSPEEKIRELLCQNAPVLTGLKPSAIINVSEREYSLLCRLFTGSSLKLRPLFFDGRVSLILYREEKLRALLRDCGRRRFLVGIERCYEELDMESVLCTFRQRFRAFKERRIPFPHELGILLGYPPEDVRSYIEKEGNDALVTGYWKVYHDLPSALRTFQAYDVSIQSFRLMLQHGVPIERLLDICPERSVEVA